MSKLILLISYGGGHITMIHRVYKMLISKDIDVKVLPLTTAVPYCIRNNIDYIRIEDYFSIAEIDVDYKNYVIEIAKKNYVSELEIPYSHTLAYHSIGLSELFSKHSFKEGKDIFIKKGRNSFLPLKFADKIIRLLKPSAIVTTNVPRMELAFRLQGVKMGIKVFAIDDLIGNFKKPKYISSDVVFVDNETARNNLKKINFKGEIIISGNPVYEDLYAIKNTRNVRNNKKLLILLQTGVLDFKNSEVIPLSSNFYKKFFENLNKIKLFEKFDAISVRFHPSMKKQIFWNEISKTINFEIDYETNIHKSIANNSSVLGLTSTSVYESYIFGCNVFNFSFVNKNLFKLPMPYWAQVNIEGDILLNKNSKPIVNKKTKAISSSEIIVKKIINEIF